MCGFGRLTEALERGASSRYCGGWQRARGTRPKSAVDLGALEETPARAQARTRAAATRAGREWTSAELDVALDPRLSTTTAAEQLGRSMSAVRHVRARHPGWRTGGLAVARPVE